MASPPDLSDDLSPTCELRPAQTLTSKLPPCSSAATWNSCQDAFSLKSWKPLAGEGPGGGVWRPTAVRMWGCHGGVDPLWRVTSSLGEPNVLGTQAHYCWRLSWAVTPRVCHASSTPAGVVPGLLEAAYQLLILINPAWSLITFFCHCFPQVEFHYASSRGLRWHQGAGGTRARWGLRSILSPLVLLPKRQAGV